MEKLVHQLLVVIDDVDNCQNQVAHAIRLAGLLNSDVHLLHLLRAGPGRHRKEKASATLAEMQGRLMPLLGKGHLLHCRCVQADANRFVPQYCEKYVIDLVLLQHYQPQPWSRLLYKINMEKLARQLSCPLINIPARCQPGEFKSILLPVTDQLPLRKMQFISFLTGHRQATVYLIADAQCPFLERTRQLLSENTELSVKLLPVNGNSIAKASIDYAQDLSAALILVEPGKECHMPGLLNQLFDRFIFSASPVPVMAV